MEIKTDNIARTFLLGGEPIVNQFPALQQSVYGKKLVYFDNGATTQKPLSVINGISDYYKTINSNIHRGVHYLSQTATDAYEVSRNAVKDLINARNAHEVIFTKGTTDGINMIADVLGRYTLKEGDNIIITAMEHHSNIVPWQMICERYGAKLRVIPMTYEGELIMEEFDRLLDDRTKMVSFNYVSNTLGTVNPVKELILKAHAYNVPVFVDAAQAVQHIAIDVQELDCDFLAFSGHKMYGPTGIGILYGKEEWLEKLPPYQGGGDMIKTVSFEKTEYNDLPFKFEAGTPHIEGAIVLKNAIDFINALGLKNILDFENGLLAYLTEQILQQVPQVEIIGTAAHKSSVVSMNVKGVHPYDVGVLLDKMGIAVRTGHHCTQPIMDFYCIPGTIRVSLAVYNTADEIDYLISSLKRAIGMLV